jgi:hypothetical protein
LLSGRIKESRVIVSFSPEAAKYEAATAEYQRIWSIDGSRIIATMERLSGLEFAETDIKVTVFEGISNSGLVGTPIKLRASYPTDSKKAALIHELGHRLNFQLVVRPKGLDTHRILYLYLYDVWVALYGRRFADEQVAVESGRTPPIPFKWFTGYDYRSAWTWALSLTPEVRAAMLRDIVKAQQDLRR